MSEQTNSLEDSEKFLQQVGDLIRGIRANRGMTRKMLAKDSTVSERYLANLEQGKGNISINLLRQVATALHTNITDLLPAGNKLTPEESLIKEFISRLSRQEQKQALETLHQKFSGNSSLPTRIALVGLRGAGKTTLGKLIQERLEIPHIRLVSEIEKLAGMPVSEIFQLSGQLGYRRFEEKVLFKALEQYDSCCIETGGSIVSEPKELNLLLTTCFVIWVKTTPEEHMERVIGQGDLRPIEDNSDAMNDLRQILTERTPYYEKAHAVLDTSGKTIEQSYAEISEIIKQKNSLSEN